MDLTLIEHSTNLRNIQLNSGSTFIIMKFQCSIRVEDQLCPQHSMKRSVNCNMYVGIMKKSYSKKPLLYLRTATNTFEYQIVNNIDCIRGLKKEADNNGRATVGFRTPKHYLMINCEYEKLLLLVKVLRKFSDSKNIELNKVAVMTVLRKPTSQSKPDTPSLEDTSNLSAKLIKQFKLDHPYLWQGIYRLKKLELKHTKNVRFPVILGRIALVEVILTDMELQNKDLLWLNELQIRTSLRSLCLSKNKLTEFPMAVIDCLSLNSLDLAHNAIQYIPSGIHRLQRLSILRISHNQLYYLPADITFLKLESIDLAFNRLYSHAVQMISNVQCNFRGSLRLEDWAALNVDTHTRLQLTAKDCPINLLQKLRSLSRCICNRIALRHPSTEYFVPLRVVRFAASSWIEPQSGTPMENSPNMYLQYHFCTFKNHCVDKRFKRENCFRLVKLVQ